MIKLENVSKFYYTNNVVAVGLSKINLEVSIGEFVAITGESGSGKTTLLNVMCGIDTYEEGEMYIDGEATSYFSISDIEKYRNTNVAFIFQTYNLIDSYTVLQNVETAIMFQGIGKKERREKAIEIINRVGLSKWINQKASKLSGGQKQRVVIARALAKDCPIIAADEPTGNLDKENSIEIIKLLKEISKDKLVLIVTHDYEEVKDFATRKIRVFDGKIIEDIKIKNPIENIENKIRLDLAANEVSFKDKALFSLRNVFASPKKTILTMILFLIFSLVILFSYASSLAIKRESAMTNYNEYFKNVNDKRIVIRKSDKSIITENDITKIKAINNVNSIIKYDYILDQEIYKVGNDDIFWGNFQISHVDIIKKEQIIGDWPKNSNEVVIGLKQGSIKKDKVEKILNHTFQFVSNFGMDENKELTVTGIYYYSNKSESNSVYFIDDDFYAMKNSTFVATCLSFLSYFDGELFNESGDYYNYYDLLIKENNTLKDNEFIISGAFYKGSENAKRFDLGFKDFYRGEIKFNNVKLTIKNVDKDYYYNTVMLEASTNDYKKIINDDIYQLSVFTANAANAENVSDKLNEMGYETLYIAGIESNNQLDALLLFFSSLGSTVTLIWFLALAFIMTYALYRIILNSKKDDIAVLRTIGASKSFVRSTMMIEAFYHVTFGYLIAYILLFTALLRYRFAQKVFAYYQFFDYITVYLIGIAVALLIVALYIKRNFKSSINKVLKTF